MAGRKQGELGYRDKLHLLVMRNSEVTMEQICEYVFGEYSMKTQAQAKNLIFLYRKQLLEVQNLHFYHDRATDSYKILNTPEEFRRVVGELSAMGHGVTKSQRALLAALEKAQEREEILAGNDRQFRQAQ